MGDLIWCDWGRLCAITSAIYMLWASFWAFFYRKFFWDFIGGTLGPAGIIPGTNTKGFVLIVVKIPLLQIFTLLIALLTILLELPVPLYENSALHRDIAVRLALYFAAAFVGVMVYQSVDCSLYYLITSLVYARAMMRGETIGAGLENHSGA
ncbi:hypothetical protein DB88DRAFT_491375 [Papiliotrema laurentii]|uniref:DUF7727 domain-containing protein n=1 Tax=Papiliotrema laurentii TaxID=5418 RepID=A0AAD9CWS2_PAPLA|nr:hypothetical protein DB88DRAFT_491375 [Papiliotrema laurentii]